MKLIEETIRNLILRDEDYVITFSWSSSSQDNLWHMHHVDKNNVVGAMGLFSNEEEIKEHLDLLQKVIFHLYNEKYMENSFDPPLLKINEGKVSISLSYSVFLGKRYFTYKKQIEISEIKELEDFTLNEKEKEIIIIKTQLDNDDMEILTNNGYQEISSSSIQDAKLFSSSKSAESYIQEEKHDGNYELSELPLHAFLQIMEKAPLD